jgi:hypothetical protein
MRLRNKWVWVLTLALVVVVLAVVVTACEEADDETTTSAAGSETTAAMGEMETLKIGMVLEDRDGTELQLPAPC